MSFSKPKAQKPYSKVIKWKGSDGGSFVYWDGENEVPVDFDEFIVLEEMSMITGWNNTEKKNVWSNEVLDLSSQEMKVRLGDNVFATGLYSDIKEAIQAKKGKFTIVLYALYRDEIVRVLLAGSGCGGYIDKGFNPMSKQCGVKWIGSVEGQSGTVTFWSPTFAELPLSSSQMDAAVKACDVVEAWVASGSQSTDQPENDDEEEQADPADDYKVGTSEGAYDEQDIPF